MSNAKTPARAAKRFIDIDMVAEAIAKEIQSRFGFAVDADPYDTSRTRSGDEYFDLPAPADYGIFKTIMKHAWLRVRVGRVKVGEADEHLCVFIALHYDHVSGGSNGSNIGTMWIDYDGNVMSFREG